MSSSHLVVYSSFSWQEALARRCYVPAEFACCFGLGTVDVRQVVQLLTYALD